MDLAAVHRVHMTTNVAHRFVYFVPEAAEEYAAAGVVGRGGYFGSRAAPLGAASPEVVIATFYNFSPAAVRSAMHGLWESTTPQALQSARFRVVRRAWDRAGVAMSDADIAEARSILDPVVAALDLAGKPLAAANVTVALPDDPVLALWQQITVVREWRGDAHIAVLQAGGVGPADCLVLQVGTGRFPMHLTQATRQWDDAQWASAVARLAARGWMSDGGPNAELNDAGRAGREQIEADTDRLCAPIWEPVGEQAAARLADLLDPIHAAMDAAGTYAALA